MNNKSYLFIIISVLFLIVQKPAIAQNFPIVISGNVLDAATNLPINKVKVTLSGKSLGIFTNINGRYTISNITKAEKYTLSFSHSKYKVEVKELSFKLSHKREDTIRLNISLKPNSSKTNIALDRKKRLKLFEYVQANKLAKVAKAQQLKQFAQNNPQEKAYVHQDKSYYVVGDTIWISGYVVNAQSHQPSQFSSALYVDLIDQQQQLKKQLILKLENGKASGDIILNTSYTPGMYRLRAYTKNMANKERAYLFQRKFEIGQTNQASFGGNLTYQNQIKDNQELVEYKLLLQDQFGYVLANSKFDVWLKTKQKTYAKQIFTTNAEGVIQGKLSIPSGENSPYIELVTKAKNPRYKATQSFYIPVAHTQVKVSFFPEGGNLVANLPNRVAFKATNRQGLGSAVKGKVLDDTGKEVCTFESKHLGLGSFTFTPETNKKYTAVVADQRFELPTALSNNFVLNIQASPKNRSVLLLNSASIKPEKFTIIGHCRGKPVFMAAGTVMKNQPFNTMLDHDQLPSGILTFTVFDQDDIPQCERVVFSRNPQKTLQIKIDTSLKVSAPREKVTLNFDINTFYQKNNHTNLSVAVVDEGLVKENPQHSHILSNLLLTSDIKGYIERPNYYFKDTKLATRQALDLLMMTQGWRRFTWKEVTSKNQRKVKNAIKKGLCISGTVTKPAGRPVANATVTLLSLDNKVFKVTQSNKRGKFTFDDLQLYKGTRLVFKAVTAKGRTKLKVKLDKLADTLSIERFAETPHQRLKFNMAKKTGYLKNQAKQVQLTKKLRLDPAIKMLKEVEVKAKKITGQQYSRRSVQLYNQPSYRVRVDSGHFKPLATDDFMNYIQGKVPNLQVIYKPNKYQHSIHFRGGAEMLYLLDGQPIDSETLRNLDLETVAYIDVVGVARSGIYGMSSQGGGGSAFGGVLAIYSKKNYKYPPTYRDKGIRGLTYQNGYTRTREFYVPPHDNPDFAKNKLPDYRSTIYWNPSVKVVNGKASVSFFNADAVTNYRVIVEGISSNGEIGRKTYVYKVTGRE